MFGDCPTNARGKASPGRPNYPAAKEGTVDLMRSTAPAMATYGVRADVISPEALTRITERVPEQRRGQISAPPEGHRVLAAFLVSDKAAHITGQIVHVRGNQVAVWSQPAPLRTATRVDGWTPNALAEVWDDVLGQDRVRRVRRLHRLGIPWPPPSA